jgi:hypothetical protein
MQKFQFYLVPNRITVTTNLVNCGYTTEYKKVYTRKIKIFKGIDNVLEIDVRNAEQKRQVVAGKTVRARFFDAENKVLFTVDGTAILSKQGIMKLTVPTDTIAKITPQQLIMRLTLVENGEETILYSDTQFDISAYVELMNGYNEQANLIIEEATVFNYEFDRKSFVSEILNFGHKINEDPELSIGKSIDIYVYPMIGDEFIGKVVIQASENKSTALGNVWDNLGEINITQGHDSTNQYTRVSGEYRLIRFIYPKFQIDGKTKTGHISKIKIKSSFNEPYYEINGGGANAIYTQEDYIVNGGNAGNNGA